MGLGVLNTYGHGPDMERLTAQVVKVYLCITRVKMSDYEVRRAKKQSKDFTMDDVYYKGEYAGGVAEKDERILASSVAHRNFKDKNHPTREEITASTKFVKEFKDKQSAVEWLINLFKHA